MKIINKRQAIIYNYIQKYEYWLISTWGYAKNEVNNLSRITKEELETLTVEELKNYINIYLL